MSLRVVGVFLLLLIFSFVLAEGKKSNSFKLKPSSRQVSYECEVIIVGGTTAAFAAAITSASEGAKTCLLEPTDWVGGQLTASGVPAVDFAWHKVVDNKTGFVLDVGEIDTSKPNVTPSLWKMLHALTKTGNCWVSIFCFPPEELLSIGLEPLLKSVTQNLRVFYNTVVKSVQTKADVLTSVTAIQRSPKEGVSCNGYDNFLSQDLPDWYSKTDSGRFTKKIISLNGVNGKNPIVMDATEWGEVLALSSAPFLQGIAERWDGDISGIGNDTCGQAIVFGFAEVYHENDTSEPPNPFPVKHASHYGFDGYTWNQVWNYRRLLGQNPQASPGDLTLQNWSRGNDYPFGYLFLSRKETANSIKDWQGGVNLDVLAGAEQLAYGYHYWFKKHADVSVRNKITLEGKPFGTCHGLAKLPYIRDTRRSIGLDGFVINVTQITGIAEQLTAHVFPDRIAIGAYDVDIHRVVGCSFPDYMNEYYPILPFFIPFRALTNQKFQNLLVAGKTIAQSFLVNAATRLHPVEFSCGSGAGVAASFMALNGLTSREALNHISTIQAKIKNYTPLQWNINGTLIPSN